MERISVDSLQDWIRVKNNYSSAATNAINSAIGNHDLHDEREAILAHFSHFMDSTFSITQANLRVNGHSFDSIDVASQDVEAFDEALDRRIWGLADTRLQWHKRMAKIRREVPSEIQTRMSSLFAKGQEQDHIISQLSEDDTVEGEEPLEESILVPSEIVEEFHMTSVITQELDQNMPTQQERVPRTEKATYQLKSLRY